VHHHVIKQSETSNFRLEYDSYTLPLPQKSVLTNQNEQKSLAAPTVPTRKGLLALAWPLPYQTAAELVPVNRNCITHLFLIKTAVLTMRELFY